MGIIWEAYFSKEQSSIYFCIYIVYVYKLCPWVNLMEIHSLKFVYNIYKDTLNLNTTFVCIERGFQITIK